MGDITFVQPRVVERTVLPTVVSAFTKYVSTLTQKRGSVALYVQMKAWVTPEESRSDFIFKKGVFFVLEACSPLLYNFEDEFSHHGRRDRL